jgi:hypothetical protein
MGGQGRQFCADPANAKDPRCMPAAGNNNPGRGPGANGGNGGPPPPPNGGPPPMANGFPPPPNGFDFSRRDRDAFHQRFHGFNFGFFPAPGFSITLGVHVPRSYSLKHVPRSIYRYYPQFRGYLFFVTRNGSIVIVSPRSYRIVAVL